MTAGRAEPGSEHPHSEEQDDGGSGTSGADTAEKRQAGSYGRDAEQDPSQAPASETEE